jgi:hypothetical protein
VPYVVVGNQTAADKYNIDLINCSGTSAYDWVFIKAAQTWQSLISADLEDTAVVGQPCLRNWDGEAILNCGAVDDLVVAFAVVPIDGPGKILGGASPWWIRDPPSPNVDVPVSGYTEFDSADWEWMVTNNILESVILHEMGHILGIGSLWGWLGLLNPGNCRDQTVFPLTGPVSPAPFYRGAFGNTSLPLVDPTNFRNLGAVPIEDSGGAGTRCAHWEESIYRQELMSGFVSVNGNPLSYTTALSLIDLGYTIDLDSPAIDKEFNLRTALADANPNNVKPTQFELTGCLDHMPEGLLKKLQRRSLSAGTGHGHRH